MHSSTSIIRSAILILPRSKSVTTRKTTIFSSTSTSSLPRIQLKNPCKAALLRLTPTGSGVSESFDKEEEAKNSIISYIADEDDRKPLFEPTEMKEVEELMKRLENMRERFVSVLKMDKCMSKMKGEDLEVEKIKRCVEKMGRDIFDKIWEKPIEYLRGGEGKFEDRAKDFSVVLGMFEKRMEIEKCPFH